MFKYDEIKDETNVHPRDKFKQDTEDMWKSDKDLEFEKNF